MWHIAGGATDSPTADFLKKTSQPSWDTTLMLSGAILGYSQIIAQYTNLEEGKSIKYL